MIELSDLQKKEYFKRSYQAVDGLWFMKVEEMHGFEAALELDESVWTVLPKIQARTMKAIAGLNEGIDGLYEGLTARLDLEGFDFRCQRTEYGFEVFVSRCPWHDLIVKSGRENIGETVGNLICRAENTVWASEFGEISFKRGSRICRGDATCSLVFYQKAGSLGSPHE
ncbi:MAG: hypothetical protein HPY61_04700 [Methanotrichaceae archaeon]|nr:hypothetical protein [Methanotrichaceae archaeon]